MVRTPDCDCDLCNGREGGRRSLKGVAGRVGKAWEVNLEPGVAEKRK
jgi:hypothetical protein